MREIVKNFGFEPAEITVPAGTGARGPDHDGCGDVPAPFRWSGVYRYFCEFHGAPGGHDMAGAVDVK